MSMLLDLGDKVYLGERNISNSMKWSPKIDLIKALDGRLLVGLRHFMYLSLHRLGTRPVGSWMDIPRVLNQRLRAHD